MTDTTAAPLQRQIVSVCAAFGAQTYAYAALVTSIPDLRARVQIDDAGLGLVLLTMTLMGAVGTIVADRIAVRAGSRAALMAGLAVQGTGLVLTTIASTIPVMTAVLIFIGLGMGLVSASANMQGALTERAHGTPIFGRLYASSTVGGITSTIVTLTLLSLGLGPSMPLLIGAVVMFAVAVLGAFGFDRHRSTQTVRDTSQAKARLPWKPMLLLGALVFAIEIMETTAGTWGTTYGVDALGLPAHIAPIGYSAYLAAVLVSRLVSDRLVSRYGRLRPALVAILVGILGCTLLVIAHPLPLAIAGFSLAGIASGIVLPLAYGKAGEIIPARSDEFVARVNLFNYLGSLFGAALPGVIAAALSLQWAYGMPLVAMMLAMPALVALRAARRVTVPVADAAAGGSRGIRVGD